MGLRAQCDNNQQSLIVDSHSLFFSVLKGAFNGTHFVITSPMVTKTPTSVVNIPTRKNV